MKNFNLADWALRHKSIIYYFIAVLMTFGIFSYANIGRMEDPDFTMRTMVVGVSWPGASPEEMSEQVTDKLEEKLRDLPGLDYTKSFTDGNKTVIYINLKEDIPSERIRPSWEEARNMINDEWRHLPSGVQGPIINDRFDDVYGIIYAISGDEFSYEEKRQYAEDVKRQLLSVPNVKKISLIGVQQKSLDVTINKDKLASYQVSSQDILTALRQQSAMVPAGMINTDTNNVYIRVNGIFDSVDAVKQMPLRINNQTIRLGDIADVTLTYVDPSSPQFYYEGTPAIGIAISMDAGANNIEFGKAIEAKLNTIRPMIPAGLSLDQVSNQPKIVDESIGDFSQSLFEAIAIVLIVSFASLGIRSGIVVALTIPVVVATTFVLMYENGIYLHKVSLGALIISLGLLVDDAIIVVEMMSLKLEEGYNHWRAATFAYQSTAFPMLSGTLITCAGFLPLALADGMVAEFTKSLSIVVFMALILSWFASVLVSPVLGYQIIETKEPKPESEWTKKDRFIHNVTATFYNRFESILHWSLSHHKSVLIITIGAFILSLLSFPLIKQEFFPSSTRNEIIVSMQFPQSSSIDYTAAQGKILNDYLQGNKSIETFTSYVGQGSPRFILNLEPELERANFLQYVIVTKSLEDRTALYNQLQAYLNDTFPSALINVQFLQLGPPSKYPVMLRVSGPDASQVKAIANDVKAVMQQDPELSNIAFDWPDTEPVANVHIDPDKARLLGIDSYTASLQLQSLLSGTKSGEYYEGNQTIPITFRLGNNERHNLSALSSLPIQTGNGSYVPLSQIANISMTQEEGIIWHRNMMPTIGIRANVGPNVLGNAKTKEIYNKLSTMRSQLPTGYTIELDGSAERSTVALQKLLVPMPIMLFVIMTILMFQLKKIPLMLMALFTAPLGLIGVVLALNITRTPLGFMAILGIIALSGMIIRNSIILLDQIEIHRAEGQEPREAIINSATLRFRPIMLTAAAAIMGMIPLMGSVFWSPLAIAFSGGLLVATVLTLIVLPVMYASYYRIK
ncbi:efflux RND transporter permease subunit [Veillonella agrestimuris]|uniref:efflux RND transporter permease subunit n=1 Tax=Veillonella agrestimuris TaxID=2941340 RepID=UPI00203BEA10|nr:efflux RND transporter permease subunit [Veillonella agrestimuris]